MMRALCLRAKDYGDMPIPAGAKPRHVTVIINPTSKDGWIALSAMAVVSEQLSKMDVIKAELESEEGGEKEVKTVYSLGQIEEGAYHNLLTTIPKYWYFGPLKARAALFFGALKGVPETTVARLSYSEPCSGCSWCFNQNALGEVKPPPKRRWWHSLIHRAAPQSEFEARCSKVINENCGSWQEEVTEHSQLDVSTYTQEDFSKGNHSVPRIVAKRGDHHLSLSRVRSRGLVLCWMMRLVDESSGGIMSMFVPCEPRVAQSPDDLNAATT
ncbi:hypothetical protein HPB51_002383 [Rhipicephalus microplus]|uniref:Acylglycerol kinase C-terminal domain-containing protein n=1 Tax=Rhipicephalus microplus TaxID=6941 RepID=A0A9J6DSL3_RHIMP|nr:hypothetical protein HPB51_002383 [Rhipicephalus microplus]